MKLVIISMPWQGLEYPSSALGILKATVEARLPGWVVEDLYGSVAWAEYLLESTGGVILPKDYTAVAEQVFNGVGDWVFAAALYGVPEYQVAEFSNFLRSQDIDPEVPAAMQRLAPAFVKRLAQTVLEMNADVVGFTSTFMQNVPSLALATELKLGRPHLPIVFGGANCEGVQGEALHRNFPVIDYVVRGEGEETLPQLLTRLESNEPCGDVAGLSWRSPGGESVHNEGRCDSVPIDSIPAPDYRTFYTLIDDSPVGSYVRPKLVLEAARGCWWGQLRQCTFCGLNGEAMTFRSKSPERVANEIEALVRAHSLLDVVMVDNIMDMRYVSELMPALEKHEWDLRLHYEVKSNMKPAELKALARGGVVHVQPGIESLSSSVLKLMKKGVSSVQNVLFLRSAEEEGLTVDWNFLYGFPGEVAAEYEAMIRQIPRLVHLQPPTGALRIALERFSPNYDDGSFGFQPRRPAKVYDYIYRLSRRELMDLVYLFDSPAQGINGPLEDRLKDAAASWFDQYWSSSLTWWEVEDGVAIEDGRVGWDQAEVRLQGIEAAVFKELLDGLGVESLCRRLHGRGVSASREDVEFVIEELDEAGLLFGDAGRFIALPVACAAPPVKIRG